MMVNLNEWTLSVLANDRLLYSDSFVFAFPDPWNGLQT